MARAEIDVSLEGLGEAIAALSAFEVQKRERVARALEASAIEIRDDAKGFAPVDTANLRNSISQRSTGGGQGREVYTGIEYAARQELGFEGTDSAGRTYSQKGSHFMKRGFEKNKRKTMRRLRRALS